MLVRREDKFDCAQCGGCCKLYNVLPKEEDIQRIENHGHKRSNFMNGTKLKRLKGGSCFFLKKRGKKYFCKIHKFRPDVCRKWPFAEYLGGRIVLSTCHQFKCEAIENMNPPKLIPIGSIKFKK